MVKKSKGVTIVGVLIGIMILSIALTAQIKLLASTVRREADLRNLIIATNLAREGVEIAFSWRVSHGWEWLRLKADAGNLCADISLQLEDGDCLSEELNAVSYVSGSDKFSEFKTYLYNSLPDPTLDTPPFTRTITVTKCDEMAVSDDRCLILNSKVSWENNSKDVEISKKIYNWYVP